MNLRNTSARSSRDTPGGQRSLRTLVLFCAVVCLLVLGALTIRAGIIWQKNVFDGAHPVILQLTSGSDKQYVGLIPRSKKIAILTVHNASRASSTQIIGLVPDAALETSSFVTSSSSVASLLFHTIWSSNPKTNLTVFDFIRLGLFAQTVSNTDVVTEEVTLPTSESSVDEKIGTTFSDPDLVSEEKNIEVVNASDIAGIGSKLERVLGHIGATVITIKNAQRASDTSSLVYSGEKSYTVKRLEKVLQIQAKEGESSQLTDITITIGGNDQLIRRLTK